MTYPGEQTGLVMRIGTGRTFQGDPECRAPSPNGRRDNSGIPRAPRDERTCGMGNSMRYDDREIRADVQPVQSSSIRPRPYWDDLSFRSCACAL